MNVNIMVAIAIQYTERIGKTGACNTSDNLIPGWGDMPYGICNSKTFDESFVIAMFYLDLAMFSLGISASSNNTPCISFLISIKLP